MIEIGAGDLLHADAEALVNTVNCVGIMGRGIALQFRKAYPSNFDAYKKACDRDEMTPGHMFVFDLHSLMGPRFIINFPTKVHWKGNSKIEYVESGLNDLINVVRAYGITSIALPPLGCGLGGLDWRDVRPRIEQAFAGLPDVSVILFEPVGAPEPTEMVRTAKVPGLTRGRALLLALMGRYLSALMDTSITLLEVHKAMYFMQESGQQLKLLYEEGPYGPYASNMSHVLTAIEGDFVTGYGAGGDQPDKELVPDWNMVRKAEEYIANDAQMLARLNRVDALISPFASSYGMELASTVHWVGKHKNAKNVDEAISLVYSWNERKRIFPESQIRLTWDILHRQGWLPGVSTN